MKRLLIPLLAAALGLTCSLVRVAPAAEAPLHKVLVFTKSSGFEHSVIKQNNGAPSHVEKVLTPLAAENHLEFTFTKDGSVFTPENIAKYDAFLFYTTGDLTKPGSDKNPPMTPEGKAAFLEAIRNGKGFIGTHSATDTFHGPGHTVDPYIAMIGGEFMGHGGQQVAQITCADPKFPGLGDLKDGLKLKEEWYSLKNIASDLHVIFVQQTAGMPEWMYQRSPYPETWAHLYGKGRVFSTTMAHREDTWTNPDFQKVLLSGIHWAVGDTQADVTPNVAQVCPGYDIVPQPTPKPSPSVSPTAGSPPAASAAPTAH